MQIHVSYDVPNNNLFQAKKEGRKEDHKSYGVEEHMANLQYTSPRGIHVK